MVGLMVTPDKKTLQQNGAKWYGLVYLLHCVFEWPFVS